MKEDYAFFIGIGLLAMLGLFLVVALFVLLAGAVRDNERHKRDDKRRRDEISELIKRL